MSLAGKTMFISGASRGIGLAIAKRVAADGANIALVAKTAEPHPKLPGTVYTAAKEIGEVGGQALPIVGDVRDGESVAAAVAQAVEQFGGISPLGQRKALPTVVDESALGWDRVLCSAGKRGLDIALDPRDLVRLTNGVTADICAS